MFICFNLTLYNIPIIIIFYNISLNKKKSLNPKLLNF